jgi:putative oxidoreductase
MHPLRNVAFLLGRFLIAAVFIFDATVIARSPDATASFIENAGLPGQLAWLVALCQFVGGILIIVGLWTRLAALAFAAFCIATAVLFHRNVGSINELIQAGKDLAIAGGFLFLAAAGPGAWSVDGRRRSVV